MDVFCGIALIIFDRQLPIHGFIIPSAKPESRWKAREKISASPIRYRVSSAPNMIPCAP